MSSFERPYPYPPPELLFMDHSVERMLEVGSELINLVDRHGFFDRDGKVIDIGCGYGRSLYALLDCGFRGRYLGFDILPRHISWLQANVMGRTQNLVEFWHLDVKNGRYNPQGRLDPSEVELPRMATCADLVLVFSVFTHMYADALAHYLEQIAGSMGKGSITCATFFLMNESWEACEAAGRSPIPMPHEISENCRHHSAADPLHAIAYREEWVLKEVANAGLALADEIQLGSWCGREGAPCYQDTLFLRLDES